MGTKSRETIYGSSVRAAAARASGERAEGGRMERAEKVLPLIAILFLAMLSNGERFGHVAKAQTVASMIADQIRSQGFACDEPQKATRDVKLSKPDYDVWVLTCKNATYRIGRYPDMAAKVEKLK
jgi:flavodoxin